MVGGNVERLKIVKLVFDFRVIKHHKTHRGKNFLEFLLNNCQRMERSVAGLNIRPSRVETLITEPRSI